MHGTCQQQQTLVFRLPGKKEEDRKLKSAENTHAKRSASTYLLTSVKSLNRLILVIQGSSCSYPKSVSRRLKFEV
jgi:hypothetical protein